MALLLLWPTIGSSIGYKFSGSVWTSKIYTYLRKFMPVSVTDEEVYIYYTDLNSQHPYTSNISYTSIENQLRVGWLLRFFFDLR